MRAETQLPVSGAACCTTLFAACLAGPVQGTAGQVVLALATKFDSLPLRAHPDLAACLDAACHTDLLAHPLQALSRKAAGRMLQVVPAVSG